MRMRGGWRETKAFKSVRAGCAFAALALAVSTAIAVVLVSLYVPGAWREKPFFENPADIAILSAGALGFLVGFLTEVRRK
jgi:hypothetical protein